MVHESLPFLPDQGTSKRARVFCLVFNSLRRFIWPIKHPITLFEKIREETITISQFLPLCSHRIGPLGRLGSFALFSVHHYANYHFVSWSHKLRDGAYVNTLVHLDLVKRDLNWNAPLIFQLNCMWAGLNGIFVNTIFTLWNILQFQFPLQHWSREGYIHT